MSGGAELQLQETEVGLRIWDPLPDGLRTRWGEWSRWAAIKKKQSEG
jgi:hypothetical protein